MEVVARLVIPGKLPSLNEYIDACNTHYHAGAKMKRDSQEAIGWEVKRQKLQPIYAAVTVHFHWVEARRQRDMDNIAFAKKFILDALQQMRILQGDGWKQIRGLSDTFSVDKHNPRIEVTITKAADECRGQQQKLIG